MSDTPGCGDDHIGLQFRVAAAMAADQGEPAVIWDWPYHTTIAYQPHHRRKNNAELHRRHLDQGSQ